MSMGENIKPINFLKIRSELKKFYLVYVGAYSSFFASGTTILILCLLFSLDLHSQALPRTQMRLPHSSLAMARPSHTMVQLSNERQISQTDSMNCSFYYLKGLGNKIIGNMEAAQDNFKESLKYNSSNDAAWYELALAKLNARQFPEALNFIKPAIAINPHQIWYLNLLATIYDQTAERNLLAGVYQKMEKMEPDNVNYYLGEAAALTAAGHDLEAIQVYDKVEKWVGITEEMEFQKQKLFIHLGKTEKAVASMDLLIKQNPDEPRYYLLLADIYRSAGQTSLVLNALNKAVAIDSSNGYAQLALSDFYRNQGDHPHAFIALKNAFISDDIDPEQKKKLLEDNYVNVKANNQSEGMELARILARAYPGDTQAQALYAGFLSHIPESTPEGRSAVVQLLENNHENYSLWANLVVSDFNLFDYRSAAKHATEAMEYFPNQINLYWYAGIALNQVGKTKEAIELLKKGLALADGQPELEAQLLQVMGDAYHSKGEVRLSDESYTESLKRRPDDANTLNNFGYYLSLRKKDLIKAASMVQKANKLEPGNANFEDTFAWILYNQHKYEDARAWIVRAISHDNSKNPTFADHYGDILYKLGNHENALENWKKAQAYGSKNLNLGKKIANQKVYE